ncbi:hypothetical protein SASPL_101985 [Salvia splendens]|uniref:SelT-like protein n=1 Tax=Salvia splendens TaxID=180675 RepID=A0A8X8YR12_SALSN|nr:hypothetical protein SASPL_101985 [Salvia splendens]
MDRAQLLLVGLPLFLFCSDIFSLFAPAPSKPAAPHHYHHRHPDSQPLIQPRHTPLEFPTQKTSGIGYGNTVSIDFCSSCSYSLFICLRFGRGTAVTMKNMLESQFPGINVILANYPPPLPKRLLSKVVPVVQFGVIGVIMGGEHIFPRLGLAAPPQWYYSMRANRFGNMASTWLLGNFVQSFLQNSGAFEVHCNGELAFSKLKENRFPGEIELKELVARRIVNSRLII